MKLERASPAPTCVSAKSDQSMDRPITLRHAELSAILLTEDHFRCSVCTDVLTEPVSIPCGHSYCKSCIQTYWTKPGHIGSYSCLQCRKRFNNRPELKPNSELAKMVEKLQQAGFSPALPALCYAGPGDLVCDFCTGRKLRAVKSCLTCLASYCETHVRQHYTVAALQRHTLVEATEDLDQRLCKLHHRALEVFCKTDQTFICFICMMEEHKEHDIVIAKSEAPTDERADTELTYLTKILCRRLEKGLVEMAALGRHLNLGMFYDCRSDSFSSDAFLWDESTLSSMKLSLSRPHTDVHILERDSLQERLRALDLTTPLRASVVAGLVEVSGAAAFLNHPTQPQLQDRVTLCYRTSTRLDMLSHTLLHSGAPLSLTSQKTATHVVVAVLYGIQAFFVFDDKRESREGSTALNEKYQLEIQKALASCIKTKRERGQKDGRGLEDLLKRHGQSPFSPENIQQWFLNKDAEVRALQACREKNITTVKSQEELMCILRDSQDTVLCFTLTSLEDKDPFLSALKQHIDLVSTVNTQETHLPFRLPDTSQKILSDLHSFMCTKETNEDADQTEFIAAVVPVPQLPGSSIYLYQCGNIVNCSMNLEMKPELPEILNIKQTSVTVRLQRSETQVLNHYRIEFRTVSCRNIADRKWKSVFCTGENCVVWGLTPAAQYQLRYTVMNYNSMSNYSRIKEFQTLPRARPGPILLKQTQKSLTVTWRKADGDTPVLCYMVEYMEAALEGWQSILTEGPGCECTITVPCSTCYRVRVSAVYGEGDMSRPSEEAEVPVDKWCINVSERKTSLFLKVLKLQTVKKPVELSGFTDEESEVRSFLQCLPYISQLRFHYDTKKKLSTVEFLLKLTVAAAECDAATGESFTKLLTSVCSYTTFPFDDDVRIKTSQCDFLLDLYSEVKNYETQTGRSVLPALQPVYQSTPAVWNINLSERKTSLFLEVLKLQKVIKPVELRGWSDEESEVRSFLQCLPYITQLRFPYDKEKRRSALEFLLKLTVAAAECDAATGESFTKLLTSVFSYTTFFIHYDDNFNGQKCFTDFLLDLFSQVKDYETQTGRSVLPALQPVYQSAPAVWNIDLSERKTSLFLEVLKLHTEKKPVELRGWSDEESEVRSFLQCLPYISQL
ncbi:hypothetical protein P4O66_012767, partial [Electrophorus voltai]